jgi:hypothetical protein
MAALDKAVARVYVSTEDDEGGTLERRTGSARGAPWQPKVPVSLIPC